MGMADRHKNVKICRVTEALGDAGGEGTAVLLTLPPGCLNFSTSHLKSQEQRCMSGA